MLAANGRCIGSRTPQRDESAQIKLFTDYWMESWGVDLGGVTNDYDSDGLDNLGEYGLGGDPTNDLDIGAVPTFTLGDSPLN